MHTYKPSSHHGTALFSSCFRRRHHLSAGSPKLLKEISDFEEDLSRHLEAMKLKAEQEKTILRLSWLTSALSLALQKHKEAVSLIPPLDFPLLVCDERWMSDYMDQTTRMLDLCNALTAAVSNIEQVHLLIRHACHILLGPEKALAQQEAPCSELDNITFLKEQLSGAHKSLQDWFNLQVAAKAGTDKHGAIVKEMIKGLTPPKEKALIKGKGFLYALYGANAIAVFTFYVLSLAILSDEDLFDASFQLPSFVLWSASFMHLVQLAKDEARQKAGSIFGSEDLHALEGQVKGLLGFIEALLNSNTWPLSGEGAKELAGQVNALSLYLDDVAKELELLGTELNEMFKTIVTSRSALLDKLGDSATYDV